jgi:hypothetical protein
MASSSHTRSGGMRRGGALGAALLPLLSVASAYPSSPYYPVDGVPRWSQLQRIVADPSLSTGQDFGQAVALSPGANPTLLIGAPNIAGGQGQVFAYQLNSSTQMWDFYQSMRCCPTSPGLSFALSFSGDGQMLAIGAPDAGGQPGAVEIWTRSGNTWSHDAGDTFDCGSTQYTGSSVAISPDASLMSITSDFVVCILTRAPLSSWTQVQALEPVGALPLTGLSTAVAGSAASAGFVAVGVPEYSNYQGGVYLYNCTETNVPGPCKSAQPVVQAPGTPANHYFGRTVSISADGSRLAVGAFGAAYVYFKVGAAWVWTLKQKISLGGNTTAFGSPVSLSTDGTVLLIGAAGEDGNSTGPVYTYEYNGTLFSTSQVLQPTPGPLMNSFGEAVFASPVGNVLVVGAPQDAPAGTVYVYGTAPTASASATATATASRSATRSAAATLSASSSATPRASRSSTPSATASSSARATLTSSKTMSPTATATKSHPVPTSSASRTAAATSSASSSASASATATATGTTTASPQHTEEKSVTDTAVFAGSLSAASLVTVAGVATAVTLWMRRGRIPSVQRAGFRVTYGTAPGGGGMSGGTGAAIGNPDTPHGYISMS